MSEQPTISLLTPTRNRCATYLQPAIASVRALRLSVPYEHVIVDDGSEDGTPARLAAESAADEHIRWLRHERPRGVAATRNAAAQAARGAFLVDLDDDDLLTADGVERRYQYLLARPERWAVHGNALKIDAEGRYLIGEDVRNFFCDDPGRCAELFFSSAMIPNASTAMYRREALLALGGWDESLSCCEDYDLWLRSLERFGPPGFVDAVVALYRRKDAGLGIDSIRSGAHEQNQRRVQARFGHLRPRVAGGVSR